MFKWAKYGGCQSKSQMERTRDWTDVEKGERMENERSTVQDTKQSVFDWTEEQEKRENGNSIMELRERICNPNVRGRNGIKWG